MYLVQDPGHSNSVIGVMKMRNIAPRAGIKTTSLAFQATTVTSPRLRDITILLTPTCLCGSLPERSVQYYTIDTSVVGMMTMGNIVPRAGIHFSGIPCQCANHYTT